MKSKLLTLLLIVTSLFGYLEWSENSHSFLFQAEADLILKLFTNPISTLHPFTILPILGQIMLLISLFQRKQKKLLIYFGIGGLSTLLVFIFIIGLISFNYKIVISIIPFIITAILSIRNLRKLRVQN